MLSEGWKGDEEKGWLVLIVGWCGILPFMTKPTSFFIRSTSSYPKQTKTKPSQPPIYFIMLPSCSNSLSLCLSSIIDLFIKTLHTGYTSYTKQYSFIISMREHSMVYEPYIKWYHTINDEEKQFHQDNTELKPPNHQLMEWDERGRCICWSHSTHPKNHL